MNVAYKPRYRIEPNETMHSLVLKMSAGNLGAVSVLIQIMKLGIDGFGFLLDLDDMGMMGPSIWLAYKDHCGEDFEKFKVAVRARDKAMIETVNKNGGYAVESGDSFSR